MEKSVAIPQKIKHFIQQFHFWVYTQRNLKQGVEQIFMHHFHGSIIHSSQKVEASHGSINRGMDN